MSANLCELHEQGDTHKFLLKKCDNPLILAPYLEIQKGIIANELNTHSESIHVFDENTVHKPSCSYFNSNFLTKEPMQVAFDSSNGHLTSLALHQKGICIILNQNILNEENISPSTVDFLRHIFDNESIEKVSERMWLLILFLQSRYNIESKACRATKNIKHLMMPLKRNFCNGILRLSYNAQRISNLIDPNFDHRQCGPLLSINPTNLPIVQAVSQHLTNIDIQREDFIHTE